MKLEYHLWDVFTDRALAGNALAVVPDAAGLTDAQMQAVAREFNLSETSFVLPSSVADARARFFTPEVELPFAGHPTLGTAYALRRLGRVSGETVRLELAAGVVPVTFERDAAGEERAWMAQGSPRLLSEVPQRSAVAAALGLGVDDLVATLPLQVVSAGLPFLLAPLDSLGVLGRASLEPSRLPESLPPEHRAVLAFTLDVPDADVRCRMFGAALGVREDPATGSAHGPLGWYLAHHELVPLAGESFTVLSHQGLEMGRPSALWVRVRRAEADDPAEGRREQRYAVSVGGGAVLVGRGELYL